MSSVESILRLHGPCMSSDLSKRLVDEYGLSQAAARQRVSRAGGIVCCVSTIRFARNARFIYHKDDFQSPRYKKALLEAFSRKNSAYGFAVDSLMQRNGIVPYDHFLICCGAPLKQKKHLSAEKLLLELERAGLVQKLQVDGVGECVIVTFENSGDVTKLQARLFTEKLLINSISNWAKNLGLVSYQKIVQRGRGDGLPQIGTTVWDIAGPSYISALTDISTTPIKPGFFACDVFFDGGEVTLDGIKPFIKKCETLRRLNNIGRTMFFFVAKKFSPDAFEAAKKAGIIPATVRNLFGSGVEEGLGLLIKNVINASTVSTLPPEKLIQLIDSLGKIEGAAGNLRGTLFEWLVSALINKIEKPVTVRVNKECKCNIEGKEYLAEADVISEGDSEIYFIECKAHAIGKFVDHDEVKRWVQKRIPALRKFASTHPDWKNKKLRFELWTTGKYKEESIKFLNLNKKDKNNLYVDFLDADGVQSKIKECKDKNLKKAFMENFFNHAFYKITS
ncbi:MAG: hypothetical protein ACRC9R_10115 [Enterovibrio sp.]